MTGFPVFESGQRVRSTASFGYLLDSPIRIGCEDDHTLIAPTGATKGLGHYPESPQRHR